MPPRWPCTCPIRAALLQWDRGALRLWVSISDHPLPPSCFWGALCPDLSSSWLLLLPDQPFLTAHRFLFLSFSSLFRIITKICLSVYNFLHQGTFSDCSPHTDRCPRVSKVRFTPLRFCERLALVPVFTENPQRIFVLVKIAFSVCFAARYRGSAHPEGPAWHRQPPSLGPEHQFIRASVHPSFSSSQHQFIQASGCHHFEPSEHQCSISVYFVHLLARCVLKS